MKIAPGVRLNLTKSGASARMGPRGAGVTVGTSDTTVSAGLPGTGLHVTGKVSPRPKRNGAVSTAAVQDAPPGLGGWLALLLILAALIWGILALIGWPAS